jgi:malate dehydrogenase
VVEEAYAYLPGIPGGESIAKEMDVEYCALRLAFDQNGASKVFPVGEISKHEQGLLEIAVKELKSNIAKGVAFAKK